MTAPQYAYDNTWAQARERLAGLERTFDPGTIRHLEAVGVAPGAHCLEVGAGGGSIADWLCRQVGEQGRVVATDLDVRFVAALQYPQLEARQHNILTDALEDRAFDRIHVRLLLHHLPDPELALRKLVAALKPGGWLVAEEPDAELVLQDPRMDETAAALYRKVGEAMVRMLRARGGDYHYGRRLYRDLEAQSLCDLGGEWRALIFRGGTPFAQALSLSFAQVREGLLGVGGLAPQELEAYLTLLGDQEFAAMGTPISAAWGRRPVE